MVEQVRSIEVMFGRVDNQAVAADSNSDSEPENEAESKGDHGVNNNSCRSFWIPTKLCPADMVNELAERVLVASERKQQSEPNAFGSLRRGRRSKLLDTPHCHHEKQWKLRPPKCTSSKLRGTSCNGKPCQLHQDQSNPATRYLLPCRG